MRTSSTTRTEALDWLSRFKLRDKFALAYGVVLVLFAATCVLFKFSTDEVARISARQLEERQTLMLLGDVKGAVSSQQAGYRGFVITGLDDFLEPYTLGRERFASAWQQASTLMAGEFGQKAALSTIHEDMRKWQVLAERGIEIRRRLGAEAAAAQVATGEGKYLLDRLDATQQQLRDSLDHSITTSTQQLSLHLERSQRLTLWMLLGGILFGILVVLSIARHIADPLEKLTTLMARLSAGDTQIEIPALQRRDEIGELARGIAVFRDSTQKLSEREWIKSQLALLSSALQGCESQADFAQVLCACLGESLGAAYGVLFGWRESGQRLEFSGGWGVPGGKVVTSHFRLGEGFMGQCAADRRRRVVNDVPADYLPVRAAAGSALPRQLLFVPLSGRAGLLGVLEFGFLGPLGAVQLEWLDQATAYAQLALETLERGLRTRDLLQETRTQKERLQVSEEALRTQREELRANNESLRNSTITLEEQQGRLRASDEELRAANASLEEKTEELRAQKSALEDAQRSLEARARDLEAASRYKSEFMANMSHELRTPLNSLLILSKDLADNPQGNLDPGQVESARIVQESGASLLALINDILDLSKIEAGKMDLQEEAVNLQEFSQRMERHFRPLALHRQLKLEILLAPDLPQTFITDGQKLQQIVTNLMANALKFTHKGGVRLHIQRALQGTNLLFRVSDDGIGIAADKLETIFQAFEQAESGTSRRYGGTGLGLSIVKGLTRLLGGQLQLESRPGKGSIFSVTLPEQMAAAAAVRTQAAAAPQAAAHGAVLIVEDDLAFARTLAGIVSQRGMLAHIAVDGEEGLRLARELRPGCILLDIGLPRMNGWAVIEQLKRDAATRDIPVHVISGEDHAKRAAAMGAVGVLVKPVSGEAVLQALGQILPQILPLNEPLNEPSKGPGITPRRLLLVDDDEASRKAVLKLLAQTHAQVTETATAAQALSALNSAHYDCIILDLGLPEVSGFEFLEQAVRLGGLPPVVVYSARELTRDESLKLREYTDSVVIKGARSPERLLDEVSLFLHSLRKPVPPAEIRPVAHEAVFVGKTVLVVDDDMRNIFALSRTLRARGLKVVMAQDGAKAIKQLEDNPDIALVLMDIMMPGMDGYQTMRQIRARDSWSKLPLIAVTAKAMKGDREKCLEAGANDYCTKPLEVDQLLVQMRQLLASRAGIISAVQD